MWGHRFWTASNSQEDTKTKICNFPASANVMNFKVLACFFKWILAVKNFVWLKPYNLIFFKRTVTTSALLPQSSGIRNLNWPFCHPDIERLTPCNSAVRTNGGMQRGHNLFNPRNFCPKVSGRMIDETWRGVKGLPYCRRYIVAPLCQIWLERNNRITLMPA